MANSLEYRRAQAAGHIRRAQRRGRIADLVGIARACDLDGPQMLDIVMRLNDADAAGQRSA